jgi:hypothetical protein
MCESAARLLAGALLVLAATLSASAQTPSASPSSRSSQAATDHLKLRLSSRPQTIAPGGTLTLVVEVEPRRGMHVYAPGDHDYRVISLTVTPLPFVQSLPVKYPPSEVYHFVPLNERVPVYMKPFTLVQEVRIADTDVARTALANEPGEFTLFGTLAYQACDDRLCFNPVSVPVSWRIKTAAPTSTPR